MDIEKKRESDLQQIVNKYKALKENQDKVQKSEIIELERGFLSFKPFSNIYASQVNYGESQNGQPESPYGQNMNDEGDDENRESDIENQDEYENE